MLCLPSTVTFPQSVRIKENLKIIYFNFIILLFQFISTIAIFRWENQDPEWSNNLPTISEWGMWHFDATKHFLLSKNLSRNRYLPISDPHLPLYSNIFVDKDADWRGVIHILLGNILLELPLHKSWLVSNIYYFILLFVHSTNICQMSTTYQTQDAKTPRKLWTQVAPWLSKLWCGREK